MYQHDVPVKLLQHKLKEVVEICVNDVGVDVNTASVHLLKYISGINETRAKAIIEYRENLRGQSRLIGSLKELTTVKGQ